MSLKKRKSGYYSIPVILGAEHGITYTIDASSTASNLVWTQTSTYIHQTHVQEHVFEERLLREYEAQFIQQNVLQEPGTVYTGYSGGSMTVYNSVIE